LLGSAWTKLWTDHVVWTRDYIIAATTRQPDATAALNRLMKTQDDIGNAGVKAGDDRWLRTPRRSRTFSARPIRTGRAPRCST